MVLEGKGREGKRRGVLALARVVQCNRWSGSLYTIHFFVMSPFRNRIVVSTVHIISHCFCVDLRESRVRAGTTLTPNPAAIR